MTVQEQITLLNSEQGNLDQIDGYNCEICKNRGFVFKADDMGLLMAKPCKCQTARNTLKKARRSGIGDLMTYTFDRFGVIEDWQKNIKDTAQRFCNDNNSKWFYIGGQVGCGKTLICSIICSHYIRSGQSVKYMLWQEEIKKMKANVNDKSYAGIMKEYSEAEVLYIDDFLKTTRGEAPSAADMNIAFELINHRMNIGNLTTIISSEKVLEDILQYDEATMSRIYEKTGPYKINMKKDIKKNYRLKSN